MVQGLLRQADETTILISSHEITEIESFTTHVGFMDKGELLFQDSIESTLARFRMVDVTLSANNRVPAELPASWINRETGERSLRFVDTGFESNDAMRAALASKLGPVRFDAEPMSLREISKALMRAR